MTTIPVIKVRVDVDQPDNKIFIKSSMEVAEYCRDLIKADNTEWLENAFLLCLNSGNQIIGIKKISQGGIRGTIIDTRVVFMLALNTPGTTAIIVVHNHPSGNLNPSQADITLTNKLAEAGMILDIKLLDSMIITTEDHYSFADNEKL